VVKFLSPESIQGAAKNFLERFHPSLSLPVPVEEIAEFKMQLKILPLANLESSFSIDGFATVSRRAIVVDEGQMVRQPQRFRFVLAHEIAHLTIHSDLYEKARVKDISSYVQFQESLTPEESEALELEAGSFAGRILVPEKPLVEHARQSLVRLRTKFRPGSDLRSKCRAISQDICPVFEVILGVVETRLYGDGISELLGLGRRKVS